MVLDGNGPHGSIRLKNAVDANALLLVTSGTFSSVCAQLEALFRTTCHTHFHKMLFN